LCLECQFTGNVCLAYGLHIEAGEHDANQLCYDATDTSK
jgi:hypothetical protein